MNAPLVLMPDYFEALTRYHYGLGPNVPHPKPTSHLILDQWRQFDLWYAWHHSGAGGAGPRPKVWAHVPPWAWRTAEALDKKNAHPKPPPPPKPPVYKGAGPFELPGLEVAWGFNSGEFTPESLVEKAHDAGFKRLSIQAYPSLPDNGDDYNFAFLPQLLSFVKPLGIKVGVWFRADETQNSVSIIKKWVDAGAEFAGLDVETFDLGYPAHVELPVKVRAAFPTLPLAVLATFYGFREGRPTDWPAVDLAKPYIDAGVICETQSYVVDTPAASPGSMDSGAKWLGFKEWRAGLHSIPILGIYHGYTAREGIQTLKDANFGTSYSVWSAETIQPDDWAAFAAYNKT